jgi:hypothetical protein
MNTSTDYNSKQIDTRESRRSEILRPTKLFECGYCDKKTAACRMKYRCPFKDSLKFCGLPV